MESDGERWRAMGGDGERWRAMGGWLVAYCCLFYCLCVRVFGWALRVCLCLCVFGWLFVSVVACLCAGGCAQVSTFVVIALPTSPNKGCVFGDIFKVGIEL